MVILHPFDLHPGPETGRDYCTVFPFFFFHTSLTLSCGYIEIGYHHYLPTRKRERKGKGKKKEKKKRKEKNERKERKREKEKEKRRITIIASHTLNFCLHIRLPPCELGFCLQFPPCELHFVLCKRKTPHRFPLH